MRKELPLLLLMFIAGLSSALSQTYSVTGRVVDTTDREPLIGVNLTLTRQSDSLRLGAVTDLDGNFLLEEVPVGNYRLRASYIGYEALEQPLSVVDKAVDLGTLTLTTAVSVLQEIEVAGKVPPAIQRGDTTEFNAAAFKTNPDADAEDLVRKLPGVTLENGRIQAQGEEVRKVTVDGREFFGDDAAATLRNLPAEVIEKIQVFDRLSDQAQLTGFDDGNTTKTINIVTRPDRRNGQFGRIYGGYGTDERFTGGGVVNIFGGARRISIIGLTNNINQQNFANEDLLGAMGGGGGRGRGGRGGGGDFQVGQQSGISTTHSLGLNYSDEWGKNMEISGSYFFNWQGNERDQLLEREYFLPDDSTQFYLEDNLRNSRNSNHRMSLRMEYEPDSLNTFIFTPRFSFQSNELTTALSSLFQTDADRLLSRSVNDYFSNSEGFDLNGNLLYRRRLAKRGRSLSLGLSGGWNDRDAASHLDAVNDYFTGRQEGTTVVDQLTISATPTYSFGANAGYTEPLGEKGQLQLDYRIDYRLSDADRRTYDQSLETSPLDTALSSVFENNYVTQRLGLGYRLRTEKGFFSATLNAQRAGLDNDQAFPYPLMVSRRFDDLLPYVSFRYNFSRSSNLRIYYRTNTDVPSVSQLQPVIDNSNPLLLRSGNADLRQAYSHSFVGRYSLSNTEKSRSFFILFSGGLTNNYIGNSTFIADTATLLAGDILLPAGGQLSRPANLDGFRNLRSFLTYSFPVGFLRSNLNLNTSWNYNRIPSVVDDLYNYSNTQRFSQGLALTSNISENFDFTLSYNLNYNLVRNSLRADLDNNFYNHYAYGRLFWLFGPDIFFQSDVNYYQYNGQGEEFDQEFVLWNMSLGKKLFNRRGEVKLSVFDLLGQNNSIERNIEANYIEDVQTDVLSRYFLLTFTYYLRNFGTPPARDNDRPRGFDGPRNW